jgi:hypothetical protein
MHSTESCLRIIPGQPEQRTYERYEKGILDRDPDFASFRTFFCAVHNRHREMRHRDTHPKCTIVWLNSEYSALDLAAKEEYKRRFEQAKEYRNRNRSETEADKLILWLKTEIDNCSDRCENDSTHASA